MDFNSIWNLNNRLRKARSKPVNRINRDSANIGASQ